MCKTLKVLTLVLGLTLFSVVSTPAQATTAGVTGRVVDGQGNVVPGAKVTAKNRATSSERTAVTNSDGDYTITELAPGRYDITAEAPSFSRALVEDLELNVGSRQTINIDLKPGNVTETVTVTADVPLVETTKSEIGHTVTPTEIQNLPLLNRTFAGLTIVAPEARPVGNFDPTKTRIGNVAFNGGDGRSVNVNVDGGDNKDNVVGSLLQNFSYESIQEFQIQQHRWGADQGRAIGGVVNVITKSGGNSVHGSLFANFRHDDIQASTFFDNLNREANAGYRKPPFERQEAGGSIGGPIKKDRLFYFAALELFRERSFNALAPGALSQLILIPGAAPVESIATPYDDTLFSGKIDHTLASNQSMYYRFSYQSNESPNDQIATPARTDPSGGNFTTNKAYSAAINHTWNISPSTLNQFTFHFQDFKNEILPAAEGLTLNFPTGFTIGQNANTPQATEERKYQFRDDFTINKGSHTLKFGANYIHTILGGYFYFGTRGYSLTFRDTPSTIAALPAGFNTPGLLSALTFSDGAASHDQVIDQLAFYGQDDWKITRNLTLNLGLRWDANIGNLPAQDQNRSMLILRQLNHPRARALTADQDKLTRTTPSWTEFQPRIGFAWDPWGDAKTVIRGGYGIFYDQIFQNLSLFSAVQSQPEIFQTALSLSADQLASFVYTGPASLPTVPAFNFGVLQQGAVGRINDPDAKEPYVQKFSIGFQRELTSSLSISSDYVHTLGLQEPRFLNINPLISNICNSLYGGDSTVRTQCPRGTATRLLDESFIAAGFIPTGSGAPNTRVSRLEQINMFTTNNRSLFDSWTTSLKYRTSKMIMNASYVLASNRSWGGQPVASYSGNGIAVTPETQFRPEEFGPTRLDERHRIVLSGVFNLPWGLQVAPVAQYASARPYSPTAGLDLDGDGLATVDRLCAGVDPVAVYNAVRTRATGVTPTTVILGMNPRGCTQAQVNSFRTGLIVDANGNTISEGNGRFFNVDLRVGKNWKIGERIGLNTYVDAYNIFNTENLAFSQRLAISPATAAGITARGTTPQTAPGFLTPFSLFGPGFGPPVGKPFTLQFGGRFTF
ncbi:MAG TPA: TonB-dependent receptor [Pyrinomonadaceae bacterium]|nr:TonB-dependent receptor [Pyrinomonadaceae bacterium]